MRDIDTYFILFERVATTLKWPGNMWTVMLRKAQEVFAALSEEVSLDHEQVKAAILRAYELVTEAYRKMFRSLKKNDCQAYVEFAREKEVLFDRWCSSTGVKSLEDLKTLVLIEEFKNCIPERVATWWTSMFSLTSLSSVRGVARRPGLVTTGSGKAQAPLTYRYRPAGQEMLRKSRGR